MYFAPQPRALFEQRNSKSTPNMQCFGHLTSKFASRHSGVHLSQFPKVLQKGKLKKLTSKGASRHSGVQFSISHTTRWLRSYSSTLRSHKTMEKTQCFATVLPTFLRTWMFFRLTLSLFWLFLFSVSLTVLTTSWTSKLPMITNSYASVACKRFIPSCSAIGQISTGARSPLLPGFGFIAYKAGWKVYTIEQNDTTHHSPTHPPKKMCFLRGSDLA